MPNAKEIEAIKQKLRKQTQEDNQKRRRQAELAAYAKKSDVKARKSPRSKASRRDIFSKGGRMPGSGFSRRG